MRKITINGKEITVNAFKTKKGGKSKWRASNQIEGKKYEAYGKSKGEAEERLILKLNDLSCNISIGSEFFSEAMGIWLYETKRYDEIRDTTFEKYDGVYRNHIKDEPMLLSKVNSMHARQLQSFVNKSIECGTSSSTVRDVIKLIRQFVRYLMSQQILITDITLGVKIPKDESTDKRLSFTEDEVKAISDNVDLFEEPFMLKLAFASGLRLGELCALEYSDFDEHGVTVSKALTCKVVFNDDGTKSRRTIIGEPKSESGNRYVPLPDEIIKALEKHRIEAGEKFMRLGMERPTYVFTNNRGNLRDKTNVSKKFTKFLKKIGIEDTRKTFHSIRHTYVTRCLESGIDISMVKETAGHSDISITDSYSHVSKAALTEHFENAKGAVLL